MGLINLLADVGVTVYGKTFGVSLNWIGNLIKGLADGVGEIGVAIILFSLILKVITLPFDIIQRTSMRKQNLKMEENKERMEKLQQQYANDQDMYNKKVMELYKESGINMFASCLPMILSLVIFIVAINAFNAYSQYANVQNYNMMVNAYNEKMYEYCADLEEANIIIADEQVLVKDDADPNKYIYYKVALPKDESFGSTIEENKAFIEKATKSYFIDVAKVQSNAEIMSVVNAEVAEKGIKETEAIYNYFVGMAQSNVVTAYNNEISKEMDFLWIKNIWATDAIYKHPILSYTDFETEAKREPFNVNGASVTFGNISNHTDAYKQDAYNTITAKLGAQKTEANGYFILIALSIVTILVQQIVTQKSQAAQQQLGTVDGQGASQQKMTMIIMTVMFAIFSFLYSSAFSIYMITSNVLSLLSTLIINAIVDATENKKTEQKQVSRQTNNSIDRIEAAKERGRASAQASREKDEKKK